MLISLQEYAQMHGRTPDTIRQRCQRGLFKSARKIGRNWVIDDSEPLVDNRVKNGKYKNWRKKQSDPSD